MPIMCPHCSRGLGYKNGPCPPGMYCLVGEMGDEEWNTGLFHGRDENTIWAGQPVGEAGFRQRQEAWAGVIRQRQ